MNKNNKKDQELYRYIGRRIKAERQKKGLTQDEVNAVLGIGTGLLSHYEHGHIALSVGSLCRVSEALGLEVCHLLPPRGAPKPPAYLSRTGGTLGRTVEKYLIRYIGDRVVLAMNIAGWTRELLSEATGISPNSLRHGENGLKSGMSAARLYMIARALGLPVSDFFPTRDYKTGKKL